MLRENHVFEDDSGWKGILGQTGIDLVGKKDPEWLPNQTPNGAKMSLNKQSKNKIGF